MSGLLCNGCGLLNEQVAVICSGCGAQLVSREHTGSRVDRIINAPAPPAAVPVQPLPVPPPAPVVVPVPVIPVAQIVYGCPFCKSPYPPLVVEKISVGGWIVFILLFLVCFPVCWIGLLMKEQNSICATCRAVLS